MQATQSFMTDLPDDAELIAPRRMAAIVLAITPAFQEFAAVVPRNKSSKN
jgi:hypothetical protein